MNRNTFCSVEALQTLTITPGITFILQDRKGIFYEYLFCFNILACNRRTQAGKFQFRIFMRMINYPIFIVSILRVGLAGEHIEIGTKWDLTYLH